MLWSKKIYKIDESTYSYFKVKQPYYCYLYYRSDKYWAYILNECIKNIKDLLQ